MVAALARAGRSPGNRSGAPLNTGRVAFSGPVEAVRDNEALITQHLGVF